MVTATFTPVWRDDLCRKDALKNLFEVGTAALQLAQLLQETLAAKGIWGFIEK